MVHTLINTHQHVVFMITNRCDVTRPDFQLVLGTLSCTTRIVVIPTQLFEVQLPKRFANQDVEDLNVTPISGTDFPNNSHLDLDLFTIVILEKKN